MLLIAERKLAVHSLSCGEFNVSWAQREMLHEIHKFGWDYPRNPNMMIPFRIPERPTLAATLRALRLLVTRHEALRTTFTRDAGGGIRQHVASSGEVRVPQYDLGDHDLDTAGYEAMTIAGGEAFDRAEFPFRAVVVTTGDRVELVGLAAHHACVDGTGGVILCEQLRRLAADPHAHLPRAWHPRQVVAFEQSTEGQKYAERADAFHAALLRSLPEPQARPPGKAAARYWQWRLTSAAVPATVRRLASRCGCSIGTVLLAAYGVALREQLGLGECTFAFVSANRDHPMTRTAIAHLAQESSVSFTVAGASFPELCRRVAAATLPSLRYGRRDPDRYALTRAAVSAERELPEWLPFHVNLRILTARELLGEEVKRPLPLPRDVTDLTRHNSLVPVHGYAEQADGVVRFAVWTFGQEAVITLGADHPEFGEKRLLEIIRAFEQVLVDAEAGKAREP